MRPPLVGLCLSTTELADDLLRVDPELAQETAVLLMIDLVWQLLGCLLRLSSSEAVLDHRDDHVFRDLHRSSYRGYNGGGTTRCGGASAAVAPRLLMPTRGPFGRTPRAPETACILGSSACLGRGASYRGRGPVCF